MGRQIAKEQIIDYDEKYATVSALATATTEILAFRVKPGKKPYLLFLGNAVGAGGGAFVTFKLQINKCDYYPFDGSLNQWAPPESNYDLPVPYELPTSCEVRVVAVNSDSNAYDATARVRVIYVDFEPVDVYRR